MPTWLTGALVTARIAWSAGEAPRNSHRSPVRARSTAASNVSTASSIEGSPVMRVWKVLGLAGLAGVAATGIIIARDQRQRVHLRPEEIKARLHQRLEQQSTGARNP